MGNDVKMVLSFHRVWIKCIQEDIPHVMHRALTQGNGLTLQLTDQNEKPFSIMISPAI